MFSEPGREPADLAGTGERVHASGVREYLDVPRAQAAGKAGGFGVVIGIDRGGNAERLKQNGADVVVKDLEEVKLLV